MEPEGSSPHSQILASPAIGVLKSRRKGQAGNVARVNDVRTRNKFWFCKPQGTKLLRIPGGNNTIHLSEVG